MVTYKVGIVGVKPLLMNPASIEMLEDIKSRKRKPVVLDESPEQEAGKKIIRNDGRQAGIPDDAVGLPQEYLLACLTAAGKWVKFDARRNMSSTTESLVPALLDIEESFFPFPTLDGGTELPWKVDKRRGVNPQTNGANLIIRPMYENWSFEFTLSFDEKELSEETVKDLVAKAGKRVGLGDYRPARKGPFGKFVIRAWEKVI